MDLNPGDCVHIPSFYWYQILSKPYKQKKKASKKDDHNEKKKEISISVEFWYES